MTDEARSGTTGVLRGRSMLIGTGIGLGLMAGIDEIVFHQLLAWHHFYDGATSEIGLLSDGLLHTAEIVVLVAAFFGLADLRRRAALATMSAWAGGFLGAGGFQVFDGVIDHKVLGVHQIRYGVDLLPYDLVWNGAGVVLLVIGGVLAWRSRAEAGRAPSVTRP